MENMEAQTNTPQATGTPAQPEQATKAPSPPCTKILLFVNLGSRILTSVFLLIALIVLATNNITTFTDSVHFQDVVAYRYVMAAIVIGFTYTLVQLGFVLCQVIMGKRLFEGKPMRLFDFYADKVLCGILATGAGAGFGASIDLKNAYGISDFFNKGAATASLVLFAYLFGEASQIVSSYALPRKGDC